MPAAKPTLEHAIRREMRRRTIVGFIDPVQAAYAATLGADRFYGGRGWRKDPIRCAAAKTTGLRVAREIGLT